MSNKTPGEGMRLAQGLEPQDAATHWLWDFGQSLSHFPFSFVCQGRQRGG